MNEKLKGTFLFTGYSDETSISNQAGLLQLQTIAFA